MVKSNHRFLQVPLIEVTCRQWWIDSAGSSLLLWKLEDLMPVTNNVHFRMQEPTWFSCAIISFPSSPVHYIIIWPLEKNMEINGMKINLSHPHTCWERNRAGSLHMWFSSGFPVLETPCSGLTALPDRGEWEHHRPPTCWADMYTYNNLFTYIPNYVSSVISL